MKDNIIKGLNKRKYPNSTEQALRRGGGLVLRYFSTVTLSIYSFQSADFPRSATVVREVFRNDIP